MPDTNDQTKPVTVYSTTWCGYCKALKEYLKSKNVEFAEKDIEADAEAYKELEQKMGGEFRGVPVSDIGGTIILGFDRPKVDAALAGLR